MSQKRMYHDVMIHRQDDYIVLRADRYFNFFHLLAKLGNPKKPGNPSCFYPRSVVCVTNYDRTGWMELSCNLHFITHWCSSGTWQTTRKCSYTFRNSYFQGGLGKRELDGKGLSRCLMWVNFMKKRTWNSFMSLF